MQIFTISYFPNVLTTSLLLKSTSPRIESHENFIKQSYRSRCHILGPNDILTLSLPVQGGRKNTAIREILIDHSQRWADIQWRSITSAYQKSPFFEYYEDYVRNVVYSKEQRLFNFVLESMEVSFLMLQNKFNYKFTSSYKKVYTGDNKDYRKILNYNFHLPQPDIFTAKGYQQNFGKLFVPNLSVLDVIFCEGPSAIEIILDSSHEHN